MEDIDWNLITEDVFKIGEDNFSDLEISSSQNEEFYYFYNKAQRRLIKQFLLLEKPRVDYLCKAVLIKKDGKFSPRLTFSIRNKNGKIVQVNATNPTSLKANVNLNDCHENFWRLVSFLQSIKEIETPKSNFSLVSEGDSEIVEALRGRDVESIVKIIKELSKTEGVSLSENDISQIINRKGKLSEFRSNIDQEGDDEGWWQDFFENNKWIFGYGLNYQILRQEQTQPHYGGVAVDGRGGQKGDYLTSTVGDINFTVLVEIKTPNTPLLQGTEEIRNGAWSLSKNLTDAIAQIQANIDMWEKQGSRQQDNVDRLEGEEVYTVEPKGIIVIGKLSQLTNRNRRETFQRLRRSIHGVDILTFDELLKRAEFIVEERIENKAVTVAESSPTEMLPEDIPF